MSKSIAQRQREWQKDKKCLTLRNIEKDKPKEQMHKGKTKPSKFPKETQ